MNSDTNRTEVLKMVESGQLSAVEAMAKLTPPQKPAIKLTMPASQKRWFRVRVTHLDTGFLIRALARGSPEDRRLRTWLREARPVGISTVSWAEFLCGPVEAEEVALAPATECPLALTTPGGAGGRPPGGWCAA